MDTTTYTITDTETGETKPLTVYTFEEGMAKVNAMIAAKEEEERAAAQLPKTCKCGRPIKERRTPTGRRAKRQYETCYTCATDAMAQEYSHLVETGGNDMPPGILARKMNYFRAQGFTY